MSATTPERAQPGGTHAGGAPAEARRVSLVISAMGGQGGGVLSNWIVATAERCGYLAQATSVPGVAQRTGATIYYIECFSAATAEAAGREPVLALMPLPGDVDIVLAAELMEAGRAMLRDFVDAERTTLIASSHRDYAISERMAMGDGIADAEQMFAAARDGARRFICFDMARLAEDNGCVISAVLLGALAGAGLLPFAREAWEETIRSSGIAVERNLAGFAAGYARSQAGEQQIAAPAVRIGPIEATSPAGAALLERAGRFAPPARPIIAEGLRRLADYQDIGYAEAYLERLEPIGAIDDGGPAEAHLLTCETARHLALWMAYEDTIRVADLKTRSSRFRRVRQEVRAEPQQPISITEFMHPRFEEFCDTLPARLGRRLAGSSRARRWLAPLFATGREIRTSTLTGYLLLDGIARLRRFRRGTYRYSREQAEIERWLARIREAAAIDYALAVEIARCQALVKGYGETHERGVRSFRLIMEALGRLGDSAAAAATVARLREAALADERGEQLRAALTRLS